MVQLPPTNLMQQASHKDGTEIIHADGMLLAVMPPIGFRSELGAVLGYLKIVNGKTLKIERSELEFLDTEGTIIEMCPDAFGLLKGSHLAGPYSERFADDRQRKESASVVIWRVNDMEVMASLIEPEGIELRVAYLPQRIEKEKDPHIVFTLLNRGEKMLNIADGIRTAVCYADGTPYQSNIGGHWDGSYLLRPGHSTTRQFNLNDFPGIPQTGVREMILEILGIKSNPQTIDWKAG